MTDDDDKAVGGRALADIYAKITADNVALRARFVALVPCWSAEEVAVRFGPDLAVSGRAIVVEHDGKRHYPRLQFDDAGVLPVVEALPDRLRAALSRWQIAFWFVSSNRWLDGKAPCEVLADREQLLWAAEQEGLPMGIAITRHVDRRELQCEPARFLHADRREKLLKSLQKGASIRGVDSHHDAASRFHHQAR